MAPVVIARKHLDRRLLRLNPFGELARPPRGWVRALREALGMTGAQLGRRLHVSQARIADLERGEVAGTLTLASLEKAAIAMNCTLVYALIPNRPLEDMVRDRARQMATEQLARVNHTMRLEDQAVEADVLAEARERLVCEMIDHPKRLWDTP